MKIIKAFLMLFVLSFAGQINAQPSYLVGTAKVSIEPDKSVISLALGGYAAPKEGRFTLQWIKKGSLPEAATTMIPFSLASFINFNSSIAGSGPPPE